MEELRIPINNSAERHYQNLLRVLPMLDSLLFSRQKPDKCIPFGSIVTKTYTAQSDIDVMILNHSNSWGSSDSRALNLVSHLQKNYGIVATITANIVFFSSGGVKINAVVQKQRQIEEVTQCDSQIRLMSNNAMLRDVVRFLKLFAATYLERFPGGRTGHKPIYPGSHFYAVIASILMTEIPILSYTDSIKYVATFIGEDKYTSHEYNRQMISLRMNPSEKFESTTNRKDFNKCFRALAAHIERGVPLPSMDIDNIPTVKPIGELLAFISQEEATREQREREIRQKEDEERRVSRERLEAELAVRRLQNLSLINNASTVNNNDDSDDYYDDDDDDDDDDDGCSGGFMGSNGKMYADYCDWYESDAFDEDWHDD